MKAGSRIGPHNQDIISIIIGSLLGSGGKTGLNPAGASSFLKFTVCTDFQRSISTQSKNQTETLNPN